LFYEFYNIYRILNLLNWKVGYHPRQCIKIKIGIFTWKCTTIYFLTESENVCSHETKSYLLFERVRSWFIPSSYTNTSRFRVRLYIHALYCLSFWSLHCLFLLVIVLSVPFGHCIVCSFWSLYCLSFWSLYCLFLLVIVLSVLLVIVLSVPFGQYNDQKEQTIQWPKGTDNTMTKRNRQYNDQKEQTIQW
jgi:hypothetical protein